VLFSDDLLSFHASEDEEVFLPPLPTEKSVSDNNFHSNVENIFDNDLDNATIPNLIFENKNLVNSIKDVNLNYSSNVCDRVIKDENANDHLSKTRNDNKYIFYIRMEIVVGYRLFCW
jgi:hypothetical protein